MTPVTCSVIPSSYRRPGALRHGLRVLAALQPPDELLVVWQGDGTPTRDAAKSLRGSFPFPLRVLRCPEVGIVLAVSYALGVALGRTVLLTDDDVVAPPDWVGRHLAYYGNPTVGAVGGPVHNVGPDGRPFPTRALLPLGRVTSPTRQRSRMGGSTATWTPGFPR
jgi:GT2 family glycosyltransferase